MARAKSISIPVTGNTAPLRKALKDAQKELTLFGKASQAFGKAQNLAFGIAGAAVVQFGLDAIKSASNLEESQSKVRQVFGATAAEIEKWAGNSAKALGQSSQQALEAAGTFGNLLRAFGTTEKQAASMSMELVGLASDLASFNNTPVDEALNALRSGLTGETEPLKRFGIALTDARLRQEAMSLGLVENTNSVLPPAIKAQAAYSIALKDSALAQGDFARTSKGLANSTKTLTAQVEDLKAELGKALLPAATATVQALSDAADATEQFNNPLAGIISLLGDGAGAINNFVFEATGLNGIGNELEATWNDVWTTVTGKRREQEAADRVANLALQYEQLSAILVRDKATFEQTAEQLKRQADNAEKAERMVGYLRDQYELFSDVTLQLVEDEKEAAEERDRIAKQDREKREADAKDRAAKAKKKRIEYREDAKALRESLSEALEDARDNLKKAQEAADDFGKSLAFSFGVSLAGAYDKANDAEDDYKAALEDRKKAYDALDVAKQSDDLNAYLKAVQDLATAEEAVTTAQKARIAPAAAFAAQIEAAKSFGSNLKTLIGQGLGEAGLRQLLDLGPTAGAEVTKALLEGTAGFTVGGLNESLAALSEIQGGLASGITAALAPKGAISAAQSQVDALSSAAIGAPGVGQGFTINIVAGVGDPVEIGRQVKSVLSQYDTRAGSLVVQGGKKKGKKR